MPFAQGLVGPLPNIAGMLSTWLAFTSSTAMLSSPTAHCHASSYHSSKRTLVTPTPSHSCLAFFSSSSMRALRLATRCTWLGSFIMGQSSTRARPHAASKVLKYALQP
mmetsp:Transcript_11171/g.29137  ORF Transcript_11171/g.29137 Transcript_11171/m.29137 type:complete len:108 (-) Transcript_11171:1843-2166(-)